MPELPQNFGKAFIDWTARQALPLWSTMGWWNAQRCFLEQLTTDGTPDRSATLRVRAQARQVYVYAHAHLLGLGPDGLDLARIGLQTLRARAWAPDGTPGWVHALNPDGSVANPLRDAYDHAFVLHMLGWYYRATGERFALDWAQETLAYMDRAFAAPSGGWAEDDGGTLPRRQNPHMHGFEAMLALYEATGDAAYLARAGELFELFRTRFFDEERGVLLEFFDGHWGLLPTGQSERGQSERGQSERGKSDLLEPGHMMEWVWLLRRYEKSSGRPVADLCARLLENGRHLGLDKKSGFLVDQVLPNGEPTQPTRRLWVQTEYIKALIVEHRAGGGDTLIQEAQGVIDAMMATYLADVPAGGWNDIYDSAGKPIGTAMPASSFYHLFGAVAEMV